MFFYDKVLCFRSYCEEKRIIGNWEPMMQLGTDDAEGRKSAKHGKNVMKRYVSGMDTVVTERKVSNMSGKEKKDGKKVVISAWRGQSGTYRVLDDQNHVVCEGSDARVVMQRAREKFHVQTPSLKFVPH